LGKDRDLIADLQQLLTRQPGLTAQELAQRLHVHDWNVTPSDVQRALRAHTDRFQPSRDRDLGWQIRPAPAHRRPSAGTVAPAAGTTPATPARLAAPPGNALSALSTLPPLVRELAALVEQHPGQTTVQLAQRLGQRRGETILKGDVNSVLYKHQGKVFRKAETAPPTWHLIRATGTAAPIRQPSKPAARAAATLREVGARLNIRSWQHRALAAWEQAKYQGVVEAVTGTGKTHVGMAAAAWAAERGRRTLILVPTVDLQGQW
jgi:primosomal protein N'